MKNEKLTPKERMDANARLKAIEAEARSIRKDLKADESVDTKPTPAKATNIESIFEESLKSFSANAEKTDVQAEVVSEEKTETKEEVVSEEKTETKEEVVSEEKTETKEEEVSEEKTETKEEVVSEEKTETKEEVVSEEKTETKEEVVSEEKTETKEEEVSEEKTETKEEEVSEEKTETKEEVVSQENTETKEEEVSEEKTETEAEAVSKDEAKLPTEAKSKTHNLPLWIIEILLGAIVVLLIAMLVKPDNQVTTGDPDKTPTTDVAPGNTEEVFDMEAFVTAVANIAGTYTEDEDIATNVDVFVKKVGADKLKELVEKYGEMPTQKAIAEFLAFTPEIKMNQYISNNGLAYNPNAVIDFSQKLQELNDQYTAATGKNPDGTLMSLPGYDAFNGNRDALRALIVESGDTALLTWYNAKMEIYDTMRTQDSDTNKALAYKEEVKLELIAKSNGSINLIELQLENGVNGADANTLKYTDEYKEFIVNNYTYVVAN